MTKLREPHSIEFALNQVLKKLKDEEIKKSTGKSISHFRKCGDADDKDHNISFIENLWIPKKIKYMMYIIKNIFY